MTTTHAVLTTHKEWNSFEDRRRKIATRQRKFLERQAEAEANWKMRTSDYNDKVSQALLEGEEPPSTRQWPGPFIAPSGSIEVFINALVDVDREQRAWLQAKQPEIQKAVEAVEQDVLARAKPLVDELDRLSQELDSARRAGDLANSVVGLGSHNAQRITVETIIQASKNRTTIVSHPATDTPSQIIDRSELSAGAL